MKIDNQVISANILLLLVMQQYTRYISLFIGIYQLLILLLISFSIE